MLTFIAHNADVNVLSWNMYYCIDFWCSVNSISILYLFMLLYFIVLNRLAESLYSSSFLASGSDDGSISVHDLILLKV